MSKRRLILILIMSIAALQFSIGYAQSEESSSGIFSNKFASALHDSKAAPILSANQSQSEYWPRRTRFTDITANSSPEELSKYPMLYWRHWCDGPPRVIPLALFLFFITVLLNELVPKQLASIGQAYSTRTGFFKNAGVGWLTVTILITLIRCLFASEIGTALAQFLLAGLELLLLIGFGVSAVTLGEGICNRFNVSNRIVKGVRLRQLMVSCSGSVCLTTLLLIPRLGMLSGVGMRLVMLICIVGAGACVRRRMGTMNVEPLPGSPGATP